MDERGQMVKGRGRRTGYRMLGLSLALALLAGFVGCTRSFYRKAADKEVYDILAEKDRYPAWKIEQFHVYPDPRARFADPTNPDRPAMPPDDEAAWNLSPHSQQPGHAGVGNVEGTAYLEILKTWDKDNRAQRGSAGTAATPDASTPGPAPQSTKPANGTGATGTPATGPAGAGDSEPIQKLFEAPLTKEPDFLLTLDQSVELGVFNSREYQNFREDLYLSALPVTLQRFSFAWQWAAIENAVRQWAGAQSSVGSQNNWSLGTTVSASKMFSTGAMLLFSFANKTVFNFNGAQGFVSASTLNLDLVQPLLQGGGKAVTLEPLTQSERNLLYDIRAFARFREQFYLSIALGSTLSSNLASAAGITATGSPVSTLAALGIASTDVQGQFRGFMPTLFRQLDKAVDEKYVRDLEKTLLLYEGFQEGGQVAPLQVDQVRSTLLGARNSVLKDHQDLTNAMDQFKLQLGLPANVPLFMDDALARPITRQLDR
jgi:hypothetical protein